MVKKHRKRNLIIVCGGEKKDLSLKDPHSLFKSFKKLTFSQTEIVYLQRDSLEKNQATIDETLKDYALKRGDYEEIAVIILRGEKIEGLIGLGNLIEQGCFCLIEAESDEEESSFALPFLQTGKAHLELKKPEMGKLIELFFKYPEEVKTFFHPENKIILSTLSKFFHVEGLDLRTFTPSFLFQGFLDHCLSLIEESEKVPLNYFKDYLIFLEC